MAQALLSAHVIDTPEPLEKRRRSTVGTRRACSFARKRPADRPQFLRDRQVPTLQ
jgi:hypothetical protein